MLTVEKVDWVAAAKEAGNTVGSFKVLVSGTMRKLRDNNCYLNADGCDDGQNNGTTDEPAAKKPGRKRKTETDENSRTTKKGRKKGNVKAGESEEEDVVVFKEEPVNDENDL